MTNKVRHPSVPRLPGQKSDVKALTEIAEILLGARGDGLDKALTVKDLVDLDLLSFQRAAGIGSTQNSSISLGDAILIPDAPVEQPAGPAAATENVIISGSHIHIFIEWDAPAPQNYSYTEIWRSNVDDFGTAVRIGTTQATVYADPVGVGKGYYYWVRHVNQNDEPGPIHSTSGAYAETSQDISSIMASLSEKLTNNELALDASTFAVKPSGGATTYPFFVTSNVTYMATAMIQDASIVNAKIQDLSVDKIVGNTSNFVVSNIGLGSITNAMIGDTIQSDNYVAGVSGWIIKK